MGVSRGVHHVSPLFRPDVFMKSELVVEHREVAPFCNCSSDEDISNIETKVIATSIAACPPLPPVLPLVFYCHQYCRLSSIATSIAACPPLPPLLPLVLHCHQYCRLSSIATSIAACPPLPPVSPLVLLSFSFAPPPCFIRLWHPLHNANGCLLSVHLCY